MIAFRRRSENRPIKFQISDLATLYGYLCDVSKICVIYVRIVELKLKSPKPSPHYISVRMIRIYL